MSQKSNKLKMLWYGASALWILTVGYYLAGVLNAIDLKYEWVPAAGIGIYLIVTSLNIVYDSGWIKGEDEGRKAMQDEWVPRAKKYWDWMCAFKYCLQAIAHESRYNLGGDVVQGEPHPMEIAENILRDWNEERANIDMVFKNLPGNYVPKEEGK